MNKVKKKSVDFDFDELECLCLSLDVGDVDSMDDRLKDRLEMLTKLRVDVASENETLADVKTEDLKYLLADFYAGKLLMTIPNRVPEERLKALEKGTCVNMYDRLALTLIARVHSVRVLLPIRGQNGETQGCREAVDQEIGGVA